MHVKDEICVHCVVHLVKLTTSSICVLENTLNFTSDYPTKPFLLVN